MSRRVLAAGAIGLLFPLAALAQSIPAGFAPGALWLSTTHAEAGDAVTLYTVVYDSSKEALSGSVAFEVDGDALGSRQFSLDPGQTQIISLEWKAVAGDHSFTAILQDVSGIKGALAASTTNAVRITVEEPVPSPLDTLTDSVAGVASSPTVQGIAKSMLGTTERLRTAGADWLSDALYSDQALASSTASSSAPQGQVLGAETVKTHAASTGFFAKAKHWLFSVLLPVFQIRWLFYVALLVVIYILFKVVQGFFRYRRPY